MTDTRQPPYLREYDELSIADGRITGKSIGEVTDAIMALVTDYCREAIGEDEPEMVGNIHHVSAITRNKLRAEQRSRLEASTSVTGDSESPRGGSDPLSSQVMPDAPASGKGEQ